MAFEKITVCSDDKRDDISFNFVTSDYEIDNVSNVRVVIENALFCNLL